MSSKSQQQPTDVQQEIRWSKQLKDEPINGHAAARAGYYGAEIQIHMATAAKTVTSFVGLFCTQNYFNGMNQGGVSVFFFFLSFGSMTSFFSSPHGDVTGF